MREKLIRLEELRYLLAETGGVTNVPKADWEDPVVYDRRMGSALSREREYLEEYSELWKDVEAELGCSITWFGRVGDGRSTNPIVVTTGIDTEVGRW